MRALVESYHRSLFGLLKPLNAAMLYASFTKELYDKTEADRGAHRSRTRSAPARCLALHGSSATSTCGRLAGCYGAGFLLVWQPILWVETGQVAPGGQTAERKGTAIAWGTASPAVRHNFTVTYQALGPAAAG